jgi:hypothetical protein
VQLVDMIGIDRRGRLDQHLNDVGVETRIADGQPMSHELVEEIVVGRVSGQAGRRASARARRRDP